MEGNTYQIVIKDNILVLKTSSFKAEKGSVLHSGIFNREFASVLSAGTAVILFGFFFAIKSGLSIYFIIAALILFAVLFFVLRSYVFDEPLLETVIDKDRDLIGLTIKRRLLEKKETCRLSGLKGVEVQQVTILPENPDGIKMVENIALQHGTVIPGFGEPAVFHTVSLAFKDNSRKVVFSSKDIAEAEDVGDKLKGFIER